MARTLIEKVTATSAQTITTSVVQHGARGEGWRLWDGILRIVSETDACTVTLKAAVTDEDIDVVAVAAGPPGKSGAEIKIPGAYYIVVSGIGALGATVTVIMDGDTGKPPTTVTVA